MKLSDKVPSNHNYEYKNHNLLRHSSAWQWRWWRATMAEEWPIFFLDRTINWTLQITAALLTPCTKQRPQPPPLSSRSSDELRNRPGSTEVGWSALHFVWFSHDISSENCSENSTAASTKHVTSAAPEANYESCFATTWLRHLVLHFLYHMSRPHFRWSIQKCRRTLSMAFRISNDINSLQYCEPAWLNNPSWEKDNWWRANPTVDYQTICEQAGLHVLQCRSITFEYTFPDNEYCKGEYFHSLFHWALFWPTFSSRNKKAQDSRVNPSHLTIRLVSIFWGTQVIHLSIYW